MLIQPDNNRFETIGEVVATGMSIKANGKAFRILIDGLYSDKPGSIVRELAANAWDSHVMAGQEKPFFIHGPTELRPEFYVRDYGVGMDHTKMIELYSTLFDSDKDQSNEQVGAYGLGSKTPFAYSDQYYLSCYDGETVRHYSAAIGPNGEPQLILVETAESDEPRGVRVGFAVDLDDHPKFINAIGNVALAHNPAFESNVKDSKSFGKLTLEGNGWAWYDDGDLPSTWNVRQGCVIYPLSTTGGLSLPASNSGKWLIEAPIGTIKVVTSRESVEYTDDVLAYLTARMEALQAEVKEKVWEQVKDVETVAGFFKRLKEVSPKFINQNDFVHPLTGATGTLVDIVDPECEGVNCVYTATVDAKGRWEYSTFTRVDVNSKHVPPVIYHFKDPISRIRDTDAQREKNGDWKEGEFSRSERRRLARLARGYAGYKGAGVIHIGFGLSPPEDHWPAILPDTKHEFISFDDLRLMVPRMPLERVQNPEPAMRGLNLVIDASRTKPVKVLEPAAGKACWVQSDLYRRRPDQFLAMIGKFGYTELYIASPTAEERIAEKVPHLRDAISKRLPKGMSWADWHALLDTVLSIHGNLNEVRDTLYTSYRKQFDRIAKLDTPYGAYYRLSEPLLKAKVNVIAGHSEREIIDMMNQVTFGGPGAKSLSVDGGEQAKAVHDAFGTVADIAKTHPVRLMYNNIHDIGGEKKVLVDAVDIFVAVSGLAPTSKAFKGKNL